MFFRIFFSTITLAAFLFSSSAFSGNGSGKIPRVYATSANMVFFSTEINTNKPACNTAVGGTEWALRVDTSEGRNMYALIMLAFSTSKPIYVIGKGDCLAWPDRETVDYLYIQN